MKELSWPERGRLWFRLGLRLLFVLLACWAVTALGPTPVSYTHLTLPTIVGV